ncbi:MAG TPA: PQQ-binding-like beta-propeller repeat protein [Planctomycetaceae bacterium]|nr:PQQ-binding-like beta-propeller repeat protein [Planctomycetaceae bacterium]
MASPAPSAKSRHKARLPAAVGLTILLLLPAFSQTVRGQQPNPTDRNRPAVPPPAVAPQLPAVEPRFRESVAIETNLTAQRQVELARVHLREKRWSEGIELIRQVAANDPGSLISVGPGRYLSVDLYAQMLMAALPAEGLAVARKTIDDSAKAAMEDAMRHRDETALRSLVHKMFVARSTEQALLTLGQWAWESGNLTAARGYWSRLLPPRESSPPETLAEGLRFPDPQIEPAEIGARLVLASIVEGDPNVAHAECAAFRRRFGTTRGRLGDREGILADLLEQTAEQARGWSFPPRDTTVSTFAVNAARNGVLPREIEVGAARWAVELPIDLYSPVHSSASEREVLSTFPVVYKNYLLANTAEQIFAWDLRTGKPAWAEDRLERSAIYSAMADASAPPPAPFLVGAPRYTMTIADGRLYARMGDPTTAHSRSTLRESESSVVCLDLARGGGKLVWKVDASAIEPQSSFEGSPLVAQGRAYVAMRKGRPRMQSDVVCLETETGRRLWSRSVCAAVEDVGQNGSVLSHQLLTAGDDAVFLATGLGAIAAVEADSGSLRWVVTYESGDRDSPTSDRERRENSPCLFAQNIVVAAPGDANTLFAIDSRCGTILWRRTLPGGVEHLLGTKDGVLIVSGQSLWGLNLATGHAVWHLGYLDPASFGFGRGILAGDVVYWPTREDIYVVEQATGALRRRIPLLARYVESGGNLVLAGEFLAVAQSRRIVVFGPNAGPPLRKKQALPGTLTEDNRMDGWPVAKTGLFPILQRR